MRHESHAEPYPSFNVPAFVPDEHRDQVQLTIWWLAFLGVQAELQRPDILPPASIQSPNLSFHLHGSRRRDGFGRIVVTGIIRETYSSIATRVAAPFAQ